MNDNKKEYLIEVDGRKGKVKSEDFENNLDQFIEELPQARITVTSPDGTEGSVPLSNYKNAISKGYSAVFATYPAQQGEPEQEKSQMLPSEPQALTRHFDMTNNEVVKQTMDNNGSQKIGDFAASIPQVPIIPGQSPLDYAEKVTAVADRIQQQETEKQQQAAKEAALPQTLEEIDDKLKKIEFELKDKYDDRTGTMYSPESSDFMQIKLFNPKKNNYTPEQIKEKTALEQQRKALLLQKKFLDSIQEYQAYDQKGDQSRINRFLGGLAVKGDLQDFATLGISEITRDLEFAGILGKAERGEKLTLDESKAIQLYQNLKEIESLDRGAFFNAGAGAQQSFELMRDMLLGGMGGGISTIGRLGIKEAIKSASKQFAKKSLETMYKTALMPSFYRNVAKGNVENYSIENVGTEDKPVWDVNMKDPMSKMLYKQWAQQYSEVLTENLGSAFESVGLLTHIAKKASKAGGIIGKGARLYDKIHNKAIHNNVSKYIVEGLDKMGLQSFPMEFIEEIANVPLQSMLLGKNQFKQLADPRFYQEVAISTAALSGVGGAVNVAAGGTSALIERRKSDKAIDNYTQSIQDAIDNIDDVSHKAALSDLLSDLDKANYYDANGEFDGSQIMDDLSRVKYFEGDSQTYKDVESLVKEKLYREGQTQALKAIMEDEVGQIEYGTSGDVMAAKDKDDTFLFILGETDDTYLVSNPLTKQQKVISKADINQISAPVSVDSAVTDYFVTKATPAVTTPMPDISQVQQTQQEAQTETAQSQVPLQKGDKATYEGVSVTVDDVYTDNDGNTVAIITDDNNNSHNVPLESLSKMEPIVNKDRYILPDGRRAVIAGSDGDNIILDIIDDNNNIIDKIAAKADEISTFDKVPAEQANTIEGITSEQQAPPQEAQEAQQPDEVQQQPQQSELPVDKDGNTDYDALLESDPERFIQEYSKVVEPQVVLEQLSEVVQEIDKEIQAKNKAIKKTTSFNKKASLSADVSKLQKRRDSLTSQLLKLTQPQQESQKQIQSPVGGDIISQRWNNATKVRGNSDTRTLSDGSQLKGHWVLAEADAPTPSHDPHTLSPSEGFPTTSEGKNINDNDYTKKSAEVRIMAADYDGRAIDNPIFVKDGVVISGNNRTMSGLLAAENGTDSKYLQALQQRAQSLGFTAEQIASMKHPRVFFEVEDDVPMTTEMFAKFNQRETKSKTPTERAIVASKRDNSRLIGLILSEIDKHEKLSDVYQDANSSAAIVKYMTQTGLINSNEVPELFENGAFTANGKDFLESLLIGSIIKEDQIKILNTEGMKNIRSKIVKSIIPLAENYKLRKENQIIDDVNQAVLYLYQAKAAKLTLGELIRQNDMFESKLFDEDAVFVALKLQQSEKDFRNFVEQVNARLSTDTANMFTGELETKQDIYGEFEQQLSDSERAVIEGARENNKLSQESTLPSDGRGTITRRSEPDGVLKEPESEDAESIISLMEQYAVEAPVIEFSLKNWIEQFGLEGKISTPIGEVKIGDNQYVKIKNKGRESQWGMILPTLTNPDIVIEEESSAIEGQKTERGSSYIFVKTFIKDGQKIKYFTSVSVLKDGLEVIVSSHYIEKRALMSKIKNGRVLYMKNELLSNSSDRHLAENRNGLPDLLPTQENNSNSEGKVSKLASDIQQQSTQTVLEKAQNNAINNEIDSQAQQTNTSPSQAQKEAGNYKMGHVKVQGLNISIENPAGSTRSGVDANGQKWSVTMNNHYGYIRGTKGKDKDHIDVFLGKNQLSDKVYVIDQVNNDGSFDEHKVMIGFDSAQQARQAYLSNYSEGWNGLGNITEVSMREFKSWIDNGTRKVKPFAEYRSHSLDAIKQQAMEYSQKYGTSVEVVENAEDIKNPYARMAAQQYGLYGWYDVNSKKVYVYAPNIINNPSELEKTVLHEVVAHKGLRELLGEVAFNKLCDDVWNMMSQQDKIKWAAYAMQVAPSEVDLSQVEKGLKVKREAADEYMASFAEDGIKDQSVWQKIKQVVMDALRAMGINIQLSDADIAYMLYRSSQALKKNATIKEKAAAKKKSEQIENDLSDENIAKEKGFEEPLRLRRQKEENKINSLIGLHNISEQKLRKAIKQGGLANPSAAVIDMDKQSHDSYGEISLLMPKTLVDKKTGRNAGTFLADAWTPVYPGIRKQMSDKGSREYRKAIANLDTPLKNKIALYFQNYLDSTTVYDALFYWYALDRGLNPELVTKGLGDFTQQQIDSINALSEDGKSFWSLPEVSQQALIDAYKEKEGGVEAYNEKIKGIVEKLKANVGNLQGLRKKQVEQKIEDYEKYGVSIKSVADYYNNALRVIENFGKVDEYSTYYRAVKYVDDNNLRGDMDRWLSEKEKQFDVSEKLYAGTDNQGRQKWIPNTLENASRLMNRQGVAGAQGSASFNHFIAMAAPKATSLKQIKTKQGNLSDEEQYEQFRQEWNDIYQDLALQLQPGASAWEDYGQWRLEEMLTVSNPKAFIKKEYGIELSDEFMSKFYDLVGAIKNDFPARYFETKFTRPVMLDEFAAAVVPDNVGDDIKEVLINAGLNVATYEHDNNDQRKELIKQLSDDSIRFRYKTLSGKNVNFAQLSLFDQPAEVSQDEVMLGRKLRPLQEGEFCHVERIFTKSKMFDFTAGERIESMDDVAYIFSQLEDASIENAFAVLVKDGKPYVIHIGMGDFSSSVMNIAAIVAADNLIKADSVYMVHNHPSGNIKCSRADIGMLQKFKKAFGDRAQDGIIINLKTGQYGIFTENGIEYRADKKSPESEFPIEIYSFNKQVFDYDYDPTRLAIINSSLNVAQFISGHRLGNRAKVNILILNNRNGVVGNILSERQLSTMKDDQVDAFASEIVDYTLKMGGVNAIVYGSDIDILDNGKQKLIGKISRSVRELSGQSINVIDWLYVEGNAQRYKSAMDEGVRFRRVTDPATLEKLNSEPTIKVYRAMQVIDGKLYPPMSAVVNGKLRQPTEFGVWEEAEENPELADEKGYFKLNKGNKKSLKARYNPYIHTSRTPLNDQFSEAQTRPNLVTVEVEVPQSELTSGYKAPKAKDSVGEMEWKAGVVQSKITGKRKVILSRWDKPVRIVPDSEVAEKIVEMFGDKNIVMPSNVVTPSLRSELEKRGVPFVETDNKGKQIRFKYAPIFQSNAERATLNIKQEKATPQQWIAMLQKNGGLKAGEDKWLGLTDWLKNQNGSVTKQQILDYIRQNGIQIEEVNYVDSDNYQEKPIEDFLTEEYGYQYTQAFYVENWVGEPQAMIENLESAVELYNQYNNTKIEYSEDLSDDDYDKLLDWGQQAVNEAYIKQKKSSLNTINPVRLDYTTDFLTNNREIALVVPTIKPWNIHDEIHFGDAGEGRVVAWVRFGTTFLAREVPFVKSADNLKPPYKNVNGNEVYAVQDTKNDYIVHKSIGGGVMKYIPHVNNRLIGNTVDTAAFDTLEQAQSALNTFYKEHPLKRTVSDNILVIDEIQSKRHQEGRDKGYSSSMEGMTAERLPSGIWHIMKDGKFVAPVPSWEADSEQQALEVYAKKLVPDAPFEKNWHEVALKRMLRYAAENNYDTLAWTRGAQQAERYNIGHVVDDIWHMSDRNHFNLNRDGYSIGSVKIDKDGTIVDGNRIFEDQIGNPLSDVVGKDLANKMINSQPNDEIKLDGWMIGGEGMRGFYDKMLVDYMNKYGKKWGVKVEDIFLPDLGDRGLTMHSVKVTDAMKESVLNESQLLFRRALDGEAVTPDMIAADGIRKTMGEQSYQKMIDGIFNTLPLLEKAAIIKRGENKEKVVASIVDRICNDIPANRDALMETLIIVKDALKENPLVVLPSDTDLLVQLWKETNLEPAMTIREKLANLDKANQIRFKIDDKNDKAPTTNDVKLTRAQVWQERMVDRMVAVKVFYDELAKIGIKPSIDMNSYITENLAMSRAQTEDNHFKENIYRPMVEKVIEIEKLFIKIGLAKNDQQAYKLVNDYLYARHAPERNKNICCEEVMEKMMRSIDKIDAGFFKDGARNALMALASRIYNEKNNPSAPSTYKTFAKNIIKTKPDDPSHQQAFLQFQKKWEKLVEQAKTDMDNIFSSKSGTNRSGMTDAEAKEIMSKVYTDQTKQQLEELSDKVRQSTHFTIDTWEKYGLIDSQTGANMKKMYKYYIPLRSWEEKEDVDYDQLSNQAFNKASEIINLNRKARGRKSRADEPLVYIASLAQSAIVVGNKNMIRLNLFRLIKANDNNPALAQFASLPKVYYVETPESDTAVAYTERPAQELFDRGLVKTKTNKDYRWHKSHSEYDAHIVPVMVNGTRQMIELRGELGIKVASAINNTNVLHWQAANALKPMTNWLSAVRTSYNPEFVLTNFIRDFMFANMAYSVEGGNMLDLDKNLLKAFRSIHHLQRGKSVGDKWDAYYQEFLDNGGQTGFFAMRNIDKMKKDLETLHKQLQGGKMTVHKISQTAKNIAEYSNAMSESAMRLAVYITEREKGTSAKEAAYKAHEISVNFNRKGTWSGNFGGFYSFFNASVQGTARLGSLVWNNKGKAAAALAAISLAKLATAVIAAAVGGDDYDQLSDYVKFSNIVIPIGKDDNDKTRFLCIPMAQGVRAVTNIADNTVEVLTGNKTVWEASKTTLLNTVGEFVPLSFDAIDLTGRNTSYSIAAAIAPTAIQPWMDVWVNMDFKGDPIYKEPYMKSQEGFTPEYMNVYGNTNPILVGISKWLNDVAGGSDGRSASVWVDKNGKVKKSPFGYALDINPAKVEHLLNAYFGGLMSFPSNVIKTGYAMIDSETDVEIYNTPVVNRFIKKPYYQDGYADYFKVRDYVQTVKMTISAAKKAGDIEAAMNIQKRNTKLLMVYKSYEDRVKQLKELLNNDNLSAVNRDKLNKKMDEVILQASKDLNKIMTDEKDSRD